MNGIAIDCKYAKSVIENQPCQIKYRGFDVHAANSLVLNTAKLITMYK